MPSPLRSVTHHPQGRLAHHPLSSQSVRQLGHGMNVQAQPTNNASEDDIRIRPSSSSWSTLRRPRKLSALLLIVLVCGVLSFPSTVHATLSSTTLSATAAATAWMHHRSSTGDVATTTTTTTLSWQWMVVAMVTWMWHGTIQQWQHVWCPALTQTLQTGATWYMDQLAVHPVVTKSITAGVIGVLGDAMAQRLERFLYHRRQPPPQVTKTKGTTTTTRPQRSTKSSSQWYDSRRAFSILVDGILISGPLMHYGYECLDHLLPIHHAGAAGSSRTAAALLHVLADSVFLDAIFVATTFVVTGRVEGYTFQQVLPQLRKDYIPALKASWATSLFLLPIEFVCFRFLPLSFRVLAVNLIDVIWDAVISFMAHRSRHKTSTTVTHG